MKIRTTAAIGAAALALCLTVGIAPHASAQVTKVTLSATEAWQGKPFTAAIHQQGSSATVFYTAKAGVLPPGLTIEGPTLTGTPTKPGFYSFEVTAWDSGDLTKHQELLEVTVRPRDGAPQGTPRIQVLPMLFPVAEIPFSYRPTLAGGVAPFTWSYDPTTEPTSPAGPDGAPLGFPSWLSVDPATGTLSGTPTYGGDYRFNLRVRDALGNWSDAVVVMFVAGPPRP